MIYFLKIPVSDKSGQRWLLDEDVKVLLRVEVPEAVQADLDKVRTDLLSLSHVDQHLVHRRPHQRCAQQGRAAPHPAAARLKVGHSKLKHR